ncbi:MAG: 2-hydroxyglutaryl-CoA dehydratase, partial [Clostridia bacterium]|nr:2-hydroxyglutaryl-CoA dehydratase [Clostridia bacterium]
MSYKVGIDIGSTTVKVVVLDEQNTMLFHSYERHFSKVREKAAEQLRCVADILEGKSVKTVITGSAGLGVAEAAGIPFIQEVAATTELVSRLHPETEAVI